MQKPVELAEPLEHVVDPLEPVELSEPLEHVVESLEPVELAELAHNNKLNNTSTPTDVDFAIIPQLLLAKIYSEGDGNKPGEYRPDEEWILPVRDQKKGARRSNARRIIGIKFETDTVGAALKRIANKMSTVSNETNCIAQRLMMGHL